MLAFAIPLSPFPPRVGGISFSVLCAKEPLDMPGFLIPFCVTGAILAPLGILLWLGARERRQFLLMHDNDLRLRP